METLELIDFITEVEYYKKNNKEKSEIFEVTRLNPTNASRQLDIDGLLSYSLYVKNNDGTVTVTKQSTSGSNGDYVVDISIPEAREGKTTKIYSVKFL